MGKIELTDQERKVIELVRALAFGEVTVFVQDHKPVRIEEVRKSIKL